MHASLRAVFLSERNLTVEVTVVLTRTSASAPIKTTFSSHCQRCIGASLASACVREIIAHA